MRKIRICHVQLLPLLSGVQNMMINLLDHLVRNEYDITVISATNGPMIEKLHEMGIRHVAIPNLIQKINVYDIRIFVQFYKFFRKERFDIVHTHSSKTGFIGRIAAKLAGVKIIIHTIHGFPFHPYQSKPVRLFYQNLERIAGIFCDTAVSVNSFERELAIRKYLIKKKKIVTIYNGIRGLVSHNPIKRMELGIDDNNIIVGSVSRFSEQKNILNLIKVAIDIVKNEQNITFIFIGDGEYFNQALQLVREAGVEANIRLIGWKSNVEDWYDLFDIVVLYSKWEGLSLTILEAMSMKKPLIASDIKGNNELIIDGQNGYLIKIDDHKDLTKKIHTLSKDTLTQNKFGAESYKIFLENYTLDRFAGSYKVLYQKLIKKKL
ncbi:MAG: glycosyltransferase family 4 protein [Candidatus Cloacimonetes bacterium]|nr:glycosyltransferase family 4 protein [Candidatus Cloacimonadota bacterium]